MRCPFCDYTETQVRNSRPVEKTNSIKRRRECMKCFGRFTTLEQVIYKELQVIKKNETIRPFDPNKIRRSLQVATRKRIMDDNEIENIIEKIIRKIQRLDENTVESRYIGELVMEELQKRDKVAYVRYASVYKDFSDVDDFENFIKKLNNT